MLRVSRKLSPGTMKLIYVGRGNRRPLKKTSGMPGTTRCMPMQAMQVGVRSTAETLRFAGRVFLT